MERKHSSAAEAVLIMHANVLIKHWKIRRDDDIAVGNVCWKSFFGFASQKIVVGRYRYVDGWAENASNSPDLVL